MEYFERQNQQDCTIHSLNNAFGREVITKKEVLDYIDKLVKEYKQSLGGEVTKAEEKQYRWRFAKKKSSFFTAEVVWRAAHALGRVGQHYPIPGYGGDFSRVADLPVPLPKHIVVLGIEPKDEHHAIAIKGDMIYDSLKRKPLPLTDENMKKSLKRVFAAFVIPEVSAKTKHYAFMGPTYY